jgi:PA14 domain/PKD domain
MQPQVLRLRVTPRTRQTPLRMTALFRYEVSRQHTRAECRFPVLEWFGSHSFAGFRSLLSFRGCLLVLLVFPAAAHAAVRIQAVPVPQAMRSTAFTVTVNGLPVDVAHAANHYEFVNFDLTGAVDVAITAAEPGFWNKGVDIQPWRLDVRPVRQGQTIRFRLEGPVKLSIGRPGDFLNQAHMLFLFASTPPPAAPKGPNIHFVPPGIHRGSLNPKSGDTYYLAPGAYIFGSLNLWKVQNVRVMGRGTIVYEGSQDPNADEGWMQKPDWHCIGSLESHNVEIAGVTCIVRARTWSIQMKDSSGFTFDDLRVIGGNPGNANQDGMDWLGSSGGVVRNSFFRASDDVIALMGNWDGYTEEELLRPGKDVQNIVVENSELSTSISNIVRAGWPRKTFNSRNFTLRNSDILHTGIGACGQNFGLLGFWGANGAKGDHSNYTFEDLFLDDWYSLVQLEQEQPALHGFTFRNIWALDQPALEGSSISGKVSGVVFDNVKTEQKHVANDADLGLVVSGGAPAPQFITSHEPMARFTMTPPSFEPGDEVTFTAQLSPRARYTWLFGDGTEAHGHEVRHRFPDALGTELDGGGLDAGRFRVLLHEEDGTAGKPSYRQDWASKGVVVVGRWHNAVGVVGAMQQGLTWRIYPGEWTQLPDLSAQKAVFSGQSSNLHADPQGFTHYVATWDGLIDIPADGGYTFHLIDRDGARVVIDGIEVARTGPPFAQVCGSPGNALRYDRGSLGLRAGKHTLHLEGLHVVSEGFPRLLWEGPALQLTDVPQAAFSRVRQDAVRAGGGGQ